MCFPPPYETRYKYLSESKPGGPDTRGTIYTDITNKAVKFRRVIWILKKSLSSSMVSFAVVVLAVVQEKLRLASRCEQLAPLSRLETTCYKIFVILSTGRRGGVSALFFAPLKKVRSPNPPPPLPIPSLFRRWREVGRRWRINCTPRAVSIFRRNFGAFKKVPRKISFLPWKAIFACADKLISLFTWET